MKPSWLIQTNMDGVDTGPMIKEVVRQGMVAHQTDHKLGQSIRFREYCNHEAGDRYPVVCYGDIDFVRQVNQRSKFIPGAHCDFHNMRCSIYYAYLGEHLLNQQYLMMPAGELLRVWGRIAVATRIFNEAELLIMKETHVPQVVKSLFVRPDSGAKPFTGYVVASDDKLKIQTLVQTVGPETLVLIAPEKVISKEWRFVICAGKVIAGCQYLPTESPHYDTHALCLAISIGENDWQPDICYTVDIAESDGKVYLLEINSFSCAGLYDCDLEPIVRCVSVAAQTEWDEYFGS